MSADLPPEEARQASRDGVLKRILIPSFALIALAVVGLFIFY